MMKRRLAMVIASTLFLVLAGTGVASAYWNTHATVTSTAKVASLANSCQNITSLVNASFEEPIINWLEIRPDTEVPGWTTDDPKGIEIWADGTFGVPAPVGRQFVELNATRAGTLSQDVRTTPGQTLQWSFLHRGRAGVDTMQVLIGTPNGTVADKTLVSQGNYSDGTSGWSRYSGAYVVPTGQTTTRLSLRAISTATGDISIGNLLDDVSFGTGPCLTATSTVANITNPNGATRANDVVEYTTTVRNAGSIASVGTVLSNTLPAGLQFQPNSLKVGGDVKSDAADTDQADYVTGTRRLTARLGVGADASLGGAVGQGTSITVTFRVVVMATTRYEAESAALTGGAKVETDHGGYSGTGFVGGFTDPNKPNVPSAGFTISAATAGNYALSLRYANGNGTNKTLSVLVDGAPAQQVTLPATANWDSWSTFTQTIPLAAGAHTVSYRFLAADSGNVNLDRLDVTSVVSTIDHTPTVTYANSLAPLWGRSVTAANVRIAVTPTADVVVSSVGAPSTLTAGSAGTWTFRVVNAGPANTTGATVRVAWPNGFSASSVTRTTTDAGATTQCVVVSGNVRDCAVGTMAAGMTRTIAVSGSVAAATPAGPFTITATGSTASTSYDPNTGNNSASGMTNVTAETTPPSQVTGLTESETTSTQTTLSWTASTDNVGVVGYRVYRNDLLVGSPTSTTFTNTGLTSGTTYSYVVRAVDAAGNVSAASGARSVTTSSLSSTSWYQILSAKSAMCIDADVNDQNNGAAVALYGCASVAQQSWRFGPASDGYDIVSSRYTPTLAWNIKTDIGSGLGDGARLQLWSYGGGLNMQWLPERLADGTYRFINRNSGKCLDVVDGGTAPGTPLQQWACTGSINQAFTVRLSSTQ